MMQVRFIYYFDDFVSCIFSYQRMIFFTSFTQATFEPVYQKTQVDLTEDAFTGNCVSPSKHPVKVKEEGGSETTSPSSSSSTASFSSSSFSPSSTGSPKSSILPGRGFVKASNLPGSKKAITSIKSSSPKYTLQKANRILNFDKNRSAVYLVPYRMKKNENSTDYMVAWKLRKINADGGYKSLWLEKIFADSVKNCDTNVHYSWASKYYFLKDTMAWYQNDSPMMNDRNYPIRLFIQSFSTTGNLTKDTLVQIGNDIIEDLSALDGVKEQIKLDHQGLKEDREFCWQEVIGTKQAFALMRQEIGESEIVDTSYYGRFKQVIHVYFRENSLHPEIARKVGAPNNQIDPQYLHVEPSNHN